MYIYIYIYVYIKSTYRKKTCIDQRSSQTINSNFHTLICLSIWRCPLCNGYRRRKCTRRLELNPGLDRLHFHIALIPLGKV